MLLVVGNVNVKGLVCHVLHLASVMGDVHRKKNESIKCFVNTLNWKIILLIMSMT